MSSLQCRVEPAWRNHSKTDYSFKTRILLEIKQPRPKTTSKPCAHTTKGTLLTALGCRIGGLPAGGLLEKQFAPCYHRRWPCQGTRWQHQCVSPGLPRDILWCWGATQRAGCLLAWCMAAAGGCGTIRAALGSKLLLGPGTECRSCCRLQPKLTPACFGLFCLFKWVVRENIRLRVV